MNSALFLDPAFTHTGWIIIDVKDSSFVSCGCVSTKKQSKKKRIRVSDDDIRRCKKIAGKLIEVIDSYEPKAIALEAPSGGSLSSRSARCLGMATGIVATLESYTEIPFLYVTPNDVKVALCGKKNASKKDMMSKAKTIYPEIGELTKGDMEHVADAIGVFKVVEEDPVIRMLRSM